MRTTGLSGVVMLGGGRGDESVEDGGKEAENRLSDDVVD
jgi:hypothetical protein